MVWTDILIDFVETQTQPQLLYEKSMHWRRNIKKRKDVGNSGPLAPLSVNCLIGDRLQRLLSCQKNKVLDAKECKGVSGVQGHHILDEGFQKILRLSGLKYQPAPDKVLKI